MGKNIDRDVLDGFIEEARSYLPTILEGIDAVRRPDRATRGAV